MYSKFTFSLHKYHLLLIALLLVGISNNIQWGEDKYQKILESDARGYYAHLPAVFIYQDLNFFSYHKFYKMGITQLRFVLHNRIDEIDERFLRVMFAMTETYLKEQEDAEIADQVENLPPSKAWQPMTEEELMDRLQKSTAAYKAGEFQDIEDVEKESEKENPEKWELV